MFNFCCCHGQLAAFPAATCRPLTSLERLSLTLPAWPYVKRLTVKMKLLPSVISSLNSRVKIFVFVANSRRHFSIFYVI